MHAPRRALPAVIAVTALVFAAAACGGGSSGSSAAPAANEPTAEVAATAPAAPAAAGTPVDNDLFSTVLPDDWEVLADDLEQMGLMTLAQTGTGGATGVYLKFEGGGSWDGDPMAEAQAFADGQGGTAAEAVTINGIDWAKTSYEAGGVAQTMYITKHNGSKVTATVLGAADDPGSTAVLAAFALK
jgi:hypothetical protein